MTEPTSPPRVLVKTRLKPELHAQLKDYADRTHRTVSSAAEHLIALGLQTEQGTPGSLDPIHTR